MEPKPPTPVRVLATGAGGFIGSALLPMLAQEFPRSVLAGMRRRKPAASADVAGVACDLDDPAQLAEALRGVDLVVHAAYGDAASMPRQAENLVAAMTASGARNLVHFSSIAIYGRREGRVAEADEGLPPFDAYAEAKRRCETSFRAWSEAAPGRRAIALRPGIVYGAGSSLWIDKMAQRILSGGWGVFGPRGEGLAALIHVDDLAQQTLAACRRLVAAERESLPPFVALNAVGPESVAWNAYFQALAEALGRPPLRTWSPAGIAFRQTLAIPAKIARRTGFDLFARAALAPGPGELALFSLHADYSGAKAARILGFSPAIGLRQGLALCGRIPRLTGRNQ
jgi:nucleoside-diphosphate-sugar epimerase